MPWTSVQHSESHSFSTMEPLIKQYFLVETQEIFHNSYFICPCLKKHITHVMYARGNSKRDDVYKILLLFILNTQSGPENVYMLVVLNDDQLLLYCSVFYG
jgi:hypothetical protein